MKQIVLEKPGSFAERDAQRPVASSGQALVRIARVGVCGSDIHAFAGRHPIYTYPRIIGHELSCVLVEVPPNDRDLKPGDRCAIEPYLSCGHCRPCQKGRGNCCEQIAVLGVHVDGGLQEYLTVPLALLHKSSLLSLDQLALVETLGIGAHAVRRSGIKAGDAALVIGAGPIGIATAQFVSAAGAKAQMVEKNAERRVYVEQMGFAASPTAELLSADVVFDATGSATSMAVSLSHVSAGGVLVWVGLTREPVSLDDGLFHRKEATLLASRNSVGLFPEIIRSMELGTVDTAQWITHRLHFNEVISQFAALPARQGLVKAMIDLSDVGDSSLRTNTHTDTNHRAGQHQPKAYD